MSQKILVIDDDSFQHKMYTAALGNDYTVVSALSGSEGIALAKTEHPDLIILDVDMPDQNGYEVCQILKSEEITSYAPVLFVSSLDEIEDRLKGYAAGGADYVIKPFNLKEFKAKVQHLLTSAAEYRNLMNQAGSASTTALTAMTSMSEMGTLLESFRKFNTCVDQKMLAQALLDSLVALGLNGAIQIHLSVEPYTINVNGPATPLELSIIRHLRDDDRIVQFKSSLAINYPYISLLIHNMPIDDAERCGRLRDHLAMLIEAAETRAQTIVTENKSRHLETIERAVRMLSATLVEFNDTQRQSQLDTRQAVTQLFDRIERETLSFGLSEAQENHLAATLQSGIERLVEIQKSEIDLQGKLHSIIKELNFVLTLK